MARHVRRDTAGRWSALAVVLLVIATASFLLGVRDRLYPPAASRSLMPAPALGPPGTSAALPPEAVGAALPRSTPVALRIPAIGVAVSLSALGLRDDGTVEVPSDFDEPGWFELGPSPGQLGSAVILGHVDSHQGPAVFFRLRALRAGDLVDVSRADGGTASFAVRSVVTYPNEQFPAELVYGPHGNSALQLVTCGGSFDRTTRHYRSNVVVYTDLVGTDLIATTPAQPGRPL